MYQNYNNIKKQNQNLQAVMDTARKGVIYFSLGTVFESKDLPRAVKRRLLKCLAS